jgi:diacylglycerol O-acyltransferase
VRDEALFARCLLEGFNEILALAGELTPHAVPASFAAEPSGTLKRSGAS